MTLRKFSRGWALAVCLAASVGSAQDTESDAPTRTVVVQDRVVPESVDGVRFRGGFALNPGLALFMTPSGSLAGPLVGISARLGVQFNHYFSVFYQQMPQLVGIFASGGAAAMFLDYNSLLANVTLGHFFEIGAGPSLDYGAFASVSGSGTVATSTAFGFGLHGRLAFIIGGEPVPGVNRRNGFSISADVHPFFAGSSTALMMSLGVGAEWF